MGLRSQRTRAAASGAAPRIDAAVARFMLGSLAAIAVIVVGGFFALRSAATNEAEDETRDRVVAEGRLVEAAGLSDGIVSGDRAAIRRLDDLVQGSIRGASIVRVKLWSKDGRILYSDEPALIGARYGLGDEELHLFKTNGADAEVSDLTKPENRFERRQGKLLEAHAIIRTPAGTQLLFEIYQPVSAVNARGRALLGAIAPPLLGGLIVLVLIQLPLAWAMARRLQRGHREREALLANAVEASATERRRIAADLHDGIVQDLAGVAFGLAPLAEEAQARGDDGEAGALRRATETLRQGVRELRTLLVEIHPPNLKSAGLRVALSDLLSPLQARGIATSLDVDEAVDGAGADDPLVYRVAREAIRNAQAHAQPGSVGVTVTRAADGTRLVVSDDGRGFAPEARERRGAEGHLGLTLLEGIVAQAGGKLAVRSAPGKGTTVELDLPAR
ncbi:MAG: two-component system, NarL family, sensor kinase [Solirubrobacteraceae bacterium]|jgi:signal transduction histidine kinase|nr:two-component system, NarL family, sensor kinase [Solirubrobacteraceae bacterium]